MNSLFDSNRMGVNNGMKIWGANSTRMRGILTFILITLGVYLGFRYLLPLILPFLVAYFLAWIIRPVTETLYKRFKIPRVLGGSFSLLLLFVVFGTAIGLLINILLKQTIAFIRNIPIYVAVIADKLDNICKGCDDFMGLNSGTIRTMVDDNIISTVNKVKSNIMPQITEHTISFTIWFVAAIGIFLIVFVSAVLIVKDLPSFHENYKNNSLYKDVHRVTEKLSEAGIAYLRSQFIIMLIVAAICILGLTLIKNDYAFLVGIGIAFMDALPILGSGIIYIPWAIIMLMNGNIYVAAILITTYLICQIIREVLEPKLIGNSIGIKPLFTLIAMYIGVELFSIAGFILGPIGLVIITTVFKVLNEKSQDAAKAKNITYDED
ncbi:MAG: putative rane protein [Herbinix sp.]|jgi:sporulation integral membrane protein YtvI|nr:putative rane protein [Herbinix sp.]